MARSVLAAVRRLAARAREVVARNRISAERDEEFRFHLAMETEHNKRAGMSDADARRTAVIAFGGEQRFREETGDLRGFTAIETARRDLRFAMRRARRSPGFAAGVVATLGIGIGISVGIGSIVYDVLIRPLPYKNPESLYRISFFTPKLGVPGDLHSGASYRHFAESAKSLATLGAYYTNDGITLSDGDAAERVTAGMVTPSAFRMLGVVPLLGSLFVEGDTVGNNRGVLISQDLWKRRYGRNAAIIGKSIEINRGSRRVIGVLPRSFGFPSPNVSIWYPSYAPVDGASLSDRYFNVLARLAPGVTADAAESELNSLIPRLSSRFPTLTPEIVEQSGAHVVVRSFKSSIIGPVRAQLVLLGIMVGVVLVIATTNVVTLFLLRVERGDREIAIALSLGATPWAVVRRFVMEGIALGAMSFFVALPVAAIAVSTKLGFSDREIPRLHEVRFGVSTIAAVALLALVVGGAIGLIAISRTSVAALMDRLRSTRSTASPAWRRVQRALVAMQVAIALALLTAAGLLGRSFWNLRNARLGFEPRGTTTFEVSLPFNGYASYAEAAAFHARVIDRLRALPGVQDAAAALVLPLGDDEAPELSLPLDTGRDPLRAPIAARANLASSEYFSAMRIPIVRGRSFMAGDLRVPSIILSQALARLLFGDENPVGRQVRRVPRAGGKANVFRVVGIAGDVHGARIENGYARMIYFPILRDGDGVPRDSLPIPFVPRGARYVVRGVSAPSAQSIREVIHEADRRVPAVRIQPVMALVDAATARVRLTLLLLGIAGGAALTLGIVGVYSVVSYAASGRSREFAIRLALGATPGGVTSTVLSEGVVLGAAGVLAGLPLTWIGIRFLASLLYGVSSKSQSEFAGAALTLLALTMIATLIPARRAARTDPATVLRAE